MLALKGDGGRHSEVRRRVVGAAPAEVVEIVTSRCAMCHAREPVWAGIALPPKGIILETPEQIARAAAPVRLQAALTAAMPPNNITEMTPAERRVLAGWNAGR